jgi:transposase
MNHYVGVDVSLEASSLCIADGNGKIACEGKIASEPDAVIALIRGGITQSVDRILVN